MEEYYRAFIGQKNQAYYLDRFKKFDQQQGLKLSWNLPAFLFTGFWALHRKQWGWFFFWWMIATLFNLFDKMPHQTIQGVFAVLALVGQVLFGVVANAIYGRKCRKAITAAQKNRPTPLSSGPLQIKKAACAFKNDRQCNDILHSHVAGMGMPDLNLRPHHPHQIALMRPLFRVIGVAGLKHLHGFKTGLLQCRFHLGG